MKLKIALLAATLAAFAASTAIANEEHHADAQPGKAESVKEAKTEAKKPAKRHNHMEEKTGMPMPQPASGMDKQEAMKPMDRHDHMKEKH